MAECERFPFPVNNLAASNGASIFQRCKAQHICDVWVLTLAAVAKYPHKCGYLARCSRE